MLPATIQTKNRTHIFEHFVSRANANRAARTAFLIGEVDGKAVRVLIRNTGLGEFLVRPIAKTSKVPSEHVILWFTLNNPLCGHQPQATRL